VSLGFYPEGQGTSEAILLLTSIIKSAMCCLLESCIIKYIAWETILAGMLMSENLINFVLLNGLS
jgi:hypothetical protein